MTEMGETVPADLVIACHVLAHAGHDHFCYGHVSARLANGLIAVKCAGLALGAVRARDVAIIDADGHNRTPERRLHDETALHLAILRDRPDIGSVVHTHPPWTLAVSLVGVPDGAHSQDAVPFVDDLAVFARADLVRDESTASEVSRCLGDRRAVVLSAHGLVTVGRTVRESTVLALLLERAMATYARALTLGVPRPIPDDEVRRMRAQFDGAHDQRIADVWSVATTALTSPASHDLP